MKFLASLSWVALLGCGLATSALAQMGSGQHQPSVAFNPERNEYLIVYLETDTPFPALVARRTNGNGGVLQQVAIATGVAYSDAGPEVTYDPNEDAYVVVWKEQSPTQDWYVQFFDAVTIASRLATPVAVAPNTAYHGELALDPTSGTYLFAYSTGTSLRAIAFGNDGTLGTVATAVGTVSIDQGFQLKAGTGTAATGYFLAAWKDGSATELKTFPLHVTGVVVDTAGSVSTTASFNYRYPVMTYDRVNDEFIVTGTDVNSATSNIQLARLDSSGVALMIPQTLAVTSSSSPAIPIYNENMSQLVLAFQAGTNVNIEHYDYASVCAPDCFFHDSAAVQSFNLGSTASVYSNDSSMRLVFNDVCNNALLVFKTASPSTSIGQSLIGDPCEAQLTSDVGSLNLNAPPNGRASRTITVKAEVGPVTIAAATFARTISALRLSQNNCNGTLDIGQSCQMTVEYSGTNTGSTTLRIASDAPGSPLLVPVSVDGTATGNGNASNVRLMSPESGSHDIPGNAVLKWQRVSNDENVKYRAVLCSSATMTADCRSSTATFRQ